MSLKMSYTNSKIIGIQFSIMSPDEIRKASVAEITSKDTYINNKPVIGGLFDPRMGVLEPGMLCPTDGLTYMESPGYPGHIELARPVFYIQYLPTVLKILKCVCFKCSKLLISKTKYKQALKLNNEARWKYVFDITKDIKSCGDDTDNGCGCAKPKIKKESGLASIFAEWKGQETGEQILIKMTAEIVLKILKRISDEDVHFMGFSPVFSRPDWMICQVLSVPPPTVRPSVKHDAQQRSDDDLTHILVNIIKTNNFLKEKIQNNSPDGIIDNMTELVLQYYIATQVDNKIPGVASVAQRSGRPYKSIKDRLNGKGGRMRGNLMAKRVDFSARSVITADPNISIRELGIPLKIAKNITKPVVVNDINKRFLYKLIHSGPENWPGAKILEKENGETITLKYFADRKSIIIENGDIVHRHMMDGDAVLFNRQPTLHRMSMMCHLAKIMKQGDTFRLNVACTAPYNADFDGDEMNLHMPQDIEAEIELRNLAAVNNHLISPAKNSSIIGIFQDSMLGCYQFTRENLNFTPREAMNLLMEISTVDEMALKQCVANSGKISNFNILSQILPPLSLKYQTDSFKKSNEPEDFMTSNKVLEIKNGDFIRGQMDKKVLSGGTKGLIQRINNDFGNIAASNFIDNLQNIVTKYMVSSSFSVGVSDLMSNAETNAGIVNVIADKKQNVQTVIDNVQLGNFENNTGKTNVDEFEYQVNNILNQATNDSGKIGLNSLDKNNRFVNMVKAGSKGSDLNISFMISCLGQQNVDGKRIPYGFDQRTLPHYNKYDDSPTARGFVESSYVNGLSPQELFFHAMGGRVGLIDTAVKTSTTGYIQRRLIKGLEDLMVNYDMTIRNNKSKIVQFNYGEDNFDTVKMENQYLPLVDMNIQDIYDHYLLPTDKDQLKTFYNIFTPDIYPKDKDKVPKDKTKEAYDAIKLRKKQELDRSKKYVEMMISAKDEIIKNVFNNKDDNTVCMPVSFKYIIENIKEQMHITSTSLVNISLIDAYDIIEYYYTKLSHFTYFKPNKLFKVMYFFFLSPKELLVTKRFNKTALILLLDTIVATYKRAIVSPGEMVGVIAGQSIGEVSTQMTLNTFHFAGVASKSNITRGVPRIEEILSLSSEIKNPSLTIYLNQEDETNKEKARTIMYMLEHTKLQDLVKNVQICFDPDDSNSLISEDRNMIAKYKEFSNLFEMCNNNQGYSENKDQSKWIIRLELERDSMLEKNITMDDINFTLVNIYDSQVSCIYSDYNDDNLIFRIRIDDSLKSSTKNASKLTLDQSDKIYMLKHFQDQMLNNIVIRGIKRINKVNLRKIKNSFSEENGQYMKKDIWVLDTIGTNLIDVLSLDYIDNKRTFSNDIVEIYNVLGIEAARQMIYNELVDVIEFDGTYINYHNFSILIDRMTYSHKLISIFRHGINNDNIGPLAKASFEETPEMFLRAARHGELDNMRGVSANVMCGQEGFYGTSAFQVILNIKEMMNSQASSEYKPTNSDKLIEEFFDKEVNVEEKYCSIDNLTIKNNVMHINALSDEVDNTYDPGF